jgi:hypothetical protein
MPIVWENVGLESNHLLWLSVKCKYLLLIEWKQLCKLNGRTKMTQKQ